jgi:ribosomal protein S6--L-glutamate ligase
MKAALISLGSTSSKWTIEAMEKHFSSVDAIDLRSIEVKMGSDKAEVLANGKALPDYDCIFAKGSFRYAQILRALTSVLGKTSYMPILPYSFSVGHDKLLTHLALQHFQVPMPNTYLAATPEGGKKILEKINYPIIFKLPSGTGGKGVMYAESYAAANSLLDTLTTLRQPFLIQEYIETNGEDIRVLVAGDKVVAAMKRKAMDGEKRANTHAGGAVESYTPDAHTKEISIRAAKSLGASLCAVDILEGSKGPLVVEVNLSPGLQGITEASGVGVADKIAEYLFEQTKKLKDKGTKHGASELLKEISRKKDDTTEQQIIAQLDVRGGRLLLPNVITKISDLADRGECIIKVKEGQIIIERI